MLIYLAVIDSPEGKIKFEIIYEQYKNLMFYTANKILGDTRDSEDIVHDAFLKIIEIIDNIDDTYKIVGYGIDTFSKILYDANGNYLDCEANNDGDGTVARYSATNIMDAAQLAERNDY